MCVAYLLHRWGCRKNHHRLRPNRLICLILLDHHFELESGLGRLASPELTSVPCRLEAVSGTIQIPLSTGLPISAPQTDLILDPETDHRAFVEERKFGHAGLTSAITPVEVIFPEER